MSQAGQAGSGTITPGSVEYIAGNTGGPVAPNGSNTINIVGAGGVSVSGNPGTNTLTITSSGATEIWESISTSQTLTPNTGYFCVGGGALVLTLPVSASQGNIIEVTLDGSTSFTIAQGSAVYIRFGNQTTTIGGGGSISSNAQGDTLRMVCQIRAGEPVWNVLSSIGNLTVV